jgi:hypothetical protein
MRALFVVLAFLLAGQAFGQTQFFRVHPGHPSMSPLPPLPGASPAIEVEYPVSIDSRGIILDASARAQWALRMPDGSVKVFRESRFEPVEGFIAQGELDVQPNPALPDSAISWNWFGTSGRESLTVSAHRGRLSGTLIGVEKNFAIAQSRGRTVFRRINPLLIPLDIVGSGPRSKVIEMRPAFASAKFHDPIDVLIVHTQGAIAAAETREQLNAIIAESFNQANTVLSNSGIVSFSLRNVLAGQQDLSVEVSYNENGTPPPACEIAIVGAGACRWIAHRFWLRTSAAVQSLRNSFNADLVVMYVGDEADASGSAYVQRPNCGVEQFYEDTPGCSVGAGYNNFAFSVTSTKYATSFQVFAHEIGHQLGMEHDVVYGSPAPSFSWSYGWYVSNVNETVMSVARAFGACSICPRALQFSNPNVPFQNSSVPSGSATAWNARTGAALAPAVSEFRAPRLTQLIFRGGFEALPTP